MLLRDLLGFLVSCGQEDRDTGPPGDRRGGRQEPPAPEEAGCSLENLNLEVGAPPRLRQTHLDVDGKGDSKEKCPWGHLRSFGCGIRAQAHSRRSGWEGSFLQHPLLPPPPPLPACLRGWLGSPSRELSGAGLICIAPTPRLWVGGWVGVGAGALWESGLELGGGRRPQQLPACPLSSPSSISNYAGLLFLTRWES